MAGCELIAKCKFFNDELPNLPDYAELLKEVYCKVDFSDCARFRIFKAFGVAAVPPDIFPNEPSKAERLIASLAMKRSPGTDRP